jgi:hypothetical protein
MSTQTTHPQAAPPPQTGQAQQPKDLTETAQPKFPFVLYNHKTRQTKSAKDQEQYDKLTKQGFETEPYDAIDANLLTDADIHQIQELFAKAAYTLEKVVQLSHQLQQEKQEKQTPGGAPAAGKK